MRSNPSQVDLPRNSMIADMIADRLLRPRPATSRAEKTGACDLQKLYEGERVRSQHVSTNLNENKNGEKASTHFTSERLSEDIQRGPADPRRASCDELDPLVVDLIWEEWGQDKLSVCIGSCHVPLNYRGSKVDQALLSTELLSSEAFVLDYPN